MKTNTKHLGQVILAVAAVALIVGVILSFTTPFGNFIDNIFDKTNEQAQGDIWNSGLYDPSKPPVITMLDGEGQIFNDNTPVALTFRSSAPLNTLQSVQVDGETVDPGNYTVSEGSTIVTLDTAYLKSLDETAHTMSIVSTDGVATANFGVVDAGLYETGSNYTVMLKSWAELVEEGYLDAEGNVTAGKESEIAGVLVFPDTFTVINSSTLKNCTNLTGIKVPAGVTEIFSNTFKGYTNLETVDFDEDSQLTTIGTFAFSECTNLTSIELPASVTKIGNSAFAGCTKLSNIIIPDGCTNIEGFALWNCTSLESVEIPASVTNIDESIFMGCTNLKNITISSGKISNNMFYGCTGLTSVTIGNNVESIGTFAFHGCTSLTSIEIPDGVTSIADLAFQNCTNIESVDIGNGVTSIGADAFKGCTNLKNLKLGDGVTTIVENMFSQYANLTSVTLGNGVTNIGQRAFSQCTSLESVTIGKNVTSIDKYAFMSCENLTSIKFEGTVAQWNAITKGSLWNYEIPATEVQCSDGTVTLS